VRQQTHYFWRIAGWRIAGWRIAGRRIWNGDVAVKKGNSQHDPDFVYTVGKIVKPDVWNENRWEECESGIHFFITRIEAEKY